jgi:hypothetical protein
MTVTTAISSNPVRNNSATILGAGNVSNTTTTNVLSLADNMVHDKTTVLEAVQVGSSGNLGTFKPLSAGKFAAPMTAGNYIARGLTNQTLAGAISYTVYTACSNTEARQAIMRFKGYQRLHITSWNAVTGAASYGAQRGVTTLASGIDGKTGVLADSAANPTAAVPGNLTYMVKGTEATNDEYSPKLGGF